MAVLFLIGVRIVGAVIALFAVIGVLFGFIGTGVKSVVEFFTSEVSDHMPGHVAHL